MRHNQSNVIKGLGIAMAVGSVAAIAGSTMMGDTHKMKKNANKAMKAVGHFVDNVQYVLK